jgi:hypothetical protein
VRGLGLLLAVKTSNPAPDGGYTHTNKQKQIDVKSMGREKPDMGVIFAY